MSKIEVETMKCPMCGLTDTLSVDKAGYEAWQSGTLIQVALPKLSAPEREQLISGTCEDCWDEMQDEAEEDEDDAEEDEDDD